MSMLPDGPQRFSLVQEVDSWLLAAQERAKEAIPHAGHDTPLAPEGATLKYEQDLWQRVCTSLTEVRTLLEDLEASERQRGLRQ